MTKLGISPQKPNNVYNVRSGNVRNREQKSLFRVFYWSNGKRRKHHHRATSAQETYAPSTHGDEAGARIGDGHGIEDDTVEEIEKKFQGFRNVFEKCKVKGNNKKKPRLFNVSTGLRLTLVANTMLIDGPNKAENTARENIAEEVAVDGEDAANGDKCNHDDDEADQDSADDVMTETIVADDCSNCEASSESKCPKDVTDKVISWIDNSVKQTVEYSEGEENVFVDEEVNIFIYYII